MHGALIHMQNKITIESACTASTVNQRFCNNENQCSSNGIIVSRIEKLRFNFNTFDFFLFQVLFGK